MTFTEKSRPKFETGLGRVLTQTSLGLFVRDFLFPSGTPGECLGIFSPMSRGNGPLHRILLILSVFRPQEIVGRDFHRQSPYYDRVSETDSDFG